MSGQHLKLVEAVEKRLKRTVCIPLSGIVSFASALMEFSAARYELLPSVNLAIIFLISLIMCWLNSDSVDQSSDVNTKIASFAPKRFPIR